jgi:hypothetical protein
MDDLKLLGRNENDLKNEIKIVQTISKNINMNFGLEKCARICLKRGKVESKVHIENTFENDIKELDPRKAYKQAAHLLRSWVRLPPGAWKFVCCERRVLSGRGLCDELIARPEEPYRLWCIVVCDLETSRICTPYIYDIRSLRVNVFWKEDPAQDVTNPVRLSFVGFAFFIDSM